MMINIKEKILDNVLQKFIILLVNTNDEPIKGKLKLDKMMFLLSDVIDEIKKHGDHNANNYGPYSKAVDQELQYLEQIGVLHTNHENIAVTNMGKKIANEIIKNEDANILKILIEYKKFLNDLTREELLSYVYSAYPNATEEYENLKPNMEKYIFSLIKKQKISSQRAAELLGKSQTYIIKKMNEKGIQVLR